MKLEESASSINVRRAVEEEGYTSVATNMNMKTMVQTTDAEADNVSDHPTMLKVKKIADENRPSSGIAAKRVSKVKVKNTEKVLQINSAVDNVETDVKRATIGAEEAKTAKVGGGKTAKRRSSRVP